jgi:hypothetical protein
MRHALVASILAASLFLPATAAGQQPPQEQPAELVVTGTRQREQVRNFVDALTRAPVFGQLSRFVEAVCPETIGLSPHQNRAVAERIRSVAEAAAISVGRQGCRPNLFVIVAQDREDVIRQLRANWLDPRGDPVRIPRQSGPAVALHLEGLLDGDGVPAAVKQEEGDGRSGYYIVAGSGASSRVRPMSQPHFLLAALVVEPEALEGLTTLQLADYAAMRLLARTDPSRLENAAAPTILNVLDAPMGTAVPVTLTQWDLGFLRALYGSGERRYASRQRVEMRQLLRQELERAR